MYNQQNYYVPPPINTMDYYPPRHDTMTMFDDSDFSYERHTPFGFPTNIQMPPFAEPLQPYFPQYPYQRQLRPTRLFDENIASPFTNSQHDTLVQMPPYSMHPHYNDNANIGAPTIMSPSISRTPQMPVAASPKEKKLMVMGHRKYETMIDAMFKIRKEFPDLVEPQIKPVDPNFDVQAFVFSLGNISLEDRSTPLKAEFIEKILKMAEGYKTEVERLSEVCSDCCKRMQTLLHEQSMIRPVTKNEFEYKQMAIRAKFDNLIYNLKSRVCKAIIDHHKNYENATKHGLSQVMRSRSASSVSSEDDDDFFDDDDHFHTGKQEM